MGKDFDNNKKQPMKRYVHFSFYGLLLHTTQDTRPDTVNISISGAMGVNEHLLYFPQFCFWRGTFTKLRFPRLRDRDYTFPQPREQKTTHS